MSQLPEEYLDPATPADVVVTDVTPARITDPTLGVDLGPRRHPVPAAPAHPLVTVGDSLTHGLTSGAVYATDLSWPAQVAAALGVRPFRVPTYGGPLHGLPLNIEALVRGLQRSLGDDLELWDKARLPGVAHRLLDANEDHWERGAGSGPPPHERYDNVGIYGWDLRDALDYTAERAARLAGVDTDDDLLGAKPEADNDRAAWSVLAGFGDAATQVAAVEAIGADHGIATLVVALGSNNALGAVVDKTVRWSAAGFDDLDRKDAFNVWRPSHFAAELSLVVDRLREVPAARVVLATVPHVTIAPLAMGVNPDEPGEKWRKGSRYFPYYIDPWIAEDEFEPRKHRHLTHRQARAIDAAIDQYNVAITDAVRGCRSEGRDWLVLDLCGLLDSVAARRFGDDPVAAQRNGIIPARLPAPIADLDTRWFLSDETGLLQGGLFGLDGIHPTACGYGLVADELLIVLGAPQRIDFAALRADDTLNADPPALVKDVQEFIAPFATRFVSRRRR
jgi:hypothetical protein